MRLLVVSLVAALLGCQPNSKEESVDQSPICEDDVNATFVASTHASLNQTIIDSLSSKIVEITADYKQSQPSKRTWFIKDNKVVFDGNGYGMHYSVDNSSWNLTNENGAMVGILAPFKTSNCELISQLKLLMFIPSEEEAVADIAYATL